jgi:hypothetical protein
MTSIDFIVQKRKRVDDDDDDDVVVAVAKKPAVLTTEKSGENKAKQGKISATQLAPMGCNLPRTKNSQSLVDVAGFFPLPDGSVLEILYNVLSKDDRDEYVALAVANDERVQGKGGFSPTPRYYVCYGAEPYKFGGAYQKTIPFPDYIARTERKIMQKYPRLRTLRRWNGVDTLYNGDFNGSGGISAHSDDEHPDITDVIGYSVGQTRVLRVRSKHNKDQWYNVVMPDNSLVVMSGPNFQRNYTHQIDKLGKNSPIGARISLTIRYLAMK